MTVKNKGEYALKHFSPLDRGEWKGHTLEGNNWQIEDWTVENCAGFFSITSGAKTGRTRVRLVAPASSACARQNFATPTSLSAPQTRRVASLIFKDCLFSYEGRAAVSFDWPPYGFFASNADNIELT